MKVVFLKKISTSKIQQVLLSLRSAADDFAFKGREPYHLRRQREKCIFAKNSPENTIKMSVTVCSLRTIMKIVDTFQ